MTYIISIPFLIYSYINQSSLERPKRIWNDNIKIDHMTLGWEVVHWINLGQVRGQREATVNTVMKLTVPQKAAISFTC
jgi:hypothetical protein